MENLQKQLEKKLKQKTQLSNELKAVKKEIKDLEKEIELEKYKVVKKELEKNGMSIDDMYNQLCNKNNYYIGGEKIGEI